MKRSDGGKRCDGCFLACRSGDGANGYEYPCGPRLRAWAKEHRRDAGDAKGYVWEGEK